VTVEVPGKDDSGAGLGRGIPTKMRFAGTALVELAVAAIGYIVYSLTCGAVRGHQTIAFSNAQLTVEFERATGILIERQMQAPILAHYWLLQAFNSIYMFGHLPLVIVVALWTFAFHRPQYRVIRNAVLISGGIALIIFFVFPLAPPRLVPSLGLADTAAMVSPVYDTVEPKVFFNPYAAMPSMHIGWDVLMGFALIWCASYPFVRWAGAVLPIGMIFAIVVTGNHYVVDGLAGAAVGFFGLLIALALEQMKLGYGITTAVRRDVAVNTAD
jgi:membrane-associated phospholipid phosphatase